MRARGPWIAAVAALATAACGPRLFHDYAPPRAVPETSVVVVGSAAFLPPVQRGRRPVAVDPHDFFQSIRVGFTSTGDAALTVRRGNLRGLQGVALVNDRAGVGGYFMVEGPRSGIFLRSLVTYLGQEFSGRSFGGTVQNLYYSGCVDDFEVPIQPGDRFVYIGAFTCVHENGVGMETTVTDRFAEAQQTVGPALGGPLEHRLAVRIPGPPVLEE